MNSDGATLERLVRSEGQEASLSIDVHDQTLSSKSSALRLVKKPWPMELVLVHITMSYNLRVKRNLIQPTA